MLLMVIQHTTIGVKIDLLFPILGVHTAFIQYLYCGSESILFHFTLNTLYPFWQQVL